MRYKAGNCAIVISMKRVLNDALKNTMDYIHSLWLCVIGFFGKNMTDIKNFMILGQNSIDSKMDII